MIPRLAGRKVQKEIVEDGIETVSVINEEGMACIIE